MTQRWLLLAALAGGCGTTPDDRAPTIEVVSLEILKPTCGQVQCHSTTTAIQGYEFDTFEAAQATLQDMLRGPTFTPTRNELWVVLHDGAEERMPPDYPLDEQDMTLIQTWLEAGAPGAR